MGMVDEIDEDGSGAVDYEEFKAVMMVVVIVIIVVVVVSERLPRTSQGHSRTIVSRTCVLNASVLGTPVSRTFVSRTNVSRTCVLNASVLGKIVSFSRKDSIYFQFPIHESMFHLNLFAQQNHNKYL